MFNKNNLIKRFAQEEGKFGTPEAKTPTPSTSTSKTPSGETPASQATETKATAENAGDIFRALDMKKEARQFDLAAKASEDFSVRKKSFDNLIKIIDTAKGAAVSFEISAEPCSNMKVDESKTVSQDEIIFLFNKVLSYGNNLIKSGDKYINDFESIMNVSLPAARAKNTVLKKVNDEEIQESNFTINNNIQGIRDEMASVFQSLTMKQREARIYIALAPIKQKYFDASSNLCLVEKEANITKDIVGFYSREEMESLASGYDNMISILEEYLTIYPYLRSMQSMSNEGFKSNYQAIQNIIKKYKADKYQIYKIVFDRLRPGAKA